MLNSSLVDYFIVGLFVLFGFAAKAAIVVGSVWFLWTILRKDDK